MTKDTFALAVSPFAATLSIDGPGIPDRLEYSHFIFALNEGEIDGSVAFRSGSSYNLAHGQGALLFVDGAGNSQTMIQFSL